MPHFFVFVVLCELRNWIILKCQQLDISSEFYSNHFFIILNIVTSLSLYYNLNMKHSSQAIH